MTKNPFEIFVSFKNYLRFNLKIISVPDTEETSPSPTNGIFIFLETTKPPLLLNDLKIVFCNPVNEITKAPTIIQPNKAIIKNKIGNNDLKTIIETIKPKITSDQVIIFLLNICSPLKKKRLKIIIL